MTGQMDAETETEVNKIRAHFAKCKLELELTETSLVEYLERKGLTCKEPSKLKFQADDKFFASISAHASIVVDKCSKSSREALDEGEKCLKSEIEICEPVMPFQCESRVRNEIEVAVKDEDLDILVKEIKVPFKLTTIVDVSSDEGSEFESAPNGNFVGNQEIQENKTDEAAIPELSLLMESNVTSQLRQKEAVLVSHVVCPTSLFVNLTSSIDLLESIQAEIKRQKLTKVCCEEEVPAGRFICVLRPDTGQLWRARVLGGNRAELQVQYLDTGETVLLDPSSTLFWLPASLVVLPGLAFHCSLAQISPLPGGDWSDRSRQLLEEVTSSTACHLSLLPSSQSGPHQISLTIASESSQPGEVECCSLANYLVHKKEAVWTDGVPPQHARSSLFGTYLKLPLLTRGTEKQVIVTNVQWPDTIFIRYEASRERLEELHTDMENFYSGRVEDVSLRILSPEAGMQCVAKTEERFRTSDSNDPIKITKYIRAEIVSSIGNGLLELYFVDFGVSEVVKEENVLKLLPKFRDFPCAAVKVKLAEVRPVKGFEWESRAVEIMSGIVGKRLIMHIQDQESTSSTMEVFLYEVLKSSKKMLNINAWLVQQGLAMSTEGVVLSLKTRFTQLEDDFVKDRWSKTGNSIYSVETVSARVLNIDEAKPNSLYILHTKDEEEFYKLHQELNDHYKSCGVYGDYVKGNKGELIAVFMNFEWKRAKIYEDKKSPGKIGVKLLDGGGLCKIEQKNVRLLKEKFHFRNFVHHVGLQNIVPAGGSSWTKRSLEVFREELEKWDGVVRVQIRGKDGWRKVTPVEIIAGGVALKKILIDAGLALPVICSLDPDASPSVFSSTATKEEKEVVPLEEDESLDFSWFEKLPNMGEVFEAFATYIDWNGLIYLIPSCREETLKMIKRTLKERYGESIPRPPDRYWRAGEPAIARWSVDENWYRAIVTEVRLDGQCKVEFVDYGTPEWVDSGQDLRKDLLMKSVPIQRIKFKMDNIMPVEDSWSKKVLDYLTDIIVEQRLEVRSSGVVGTEMHGSISTKVDQLNIGSILKDNGFAQSLSD